ncbi:MAG: PAS domain S-box protein [Dehalococcoidia bacterium]|nr:PAS domain S-box protein [Dehalococcoidia bacterium]
MPSLRILVVEDEAIVAKDIQNRLKHMGYDVPSVAHTGEDAIRYAGETLPDLILMDIRLKGQMDGIEAAERIHDRWDIPVIYLTAYSDEKTLERAKATTPGAYLSKPFEDRDLRIAIEITQYRCQMEKRLKASEEKFRTIFKNANDGILYLDERGTILDANDKIGAIFGYRKEEAVGKHFAIPRTFSAPKQAELSALYQKAVSDGFARLASLDGVHTDGHPICVEASCQVIERENGERGAILVVRDITERRRAETALRESEEKYRTVVNNNPDTVWIGEQGKGIAFISPSAQAIHGYTPEELLLNGARIWLESIHPDDRQKAKNALEALEEKGVFFAIEHRFKKKDGQWVWLYARAVNAFEKDGKRFFYGLTSDITDRKRAEEETARVKAMEEADRLKTALLASVSHELRTPLTAIKGLASTLVQADVEWPPETQKEFLEVINKESDILVHLVNDLLDMSQLETRTLRLEKTKCRISSIINQLADKLKGITREHQLEIDVALDLPPIYADEVRIGQVIINLVQNAASYSEKGTRIRLEGQRANRDIMVSVTDQGIGIPSQYLGKVFERFYRLESGVARRRGGSGLGLAISKEIINFHEGAIMAESEEGKGSRFSFTLPIGEDAECLENIKPTLSDKKPRI